MDKDLYDLPPYEFYIEDKEIMDDGNIHYNLSPVSESRICPVCGGTGTKHGKYDRHVRDLPQALAQIGVTIHSNRYLCKKCGNTWGNDYESIDSNVLTTKRLRDYIKNESLDTPFKTLADRLAITDATVKRIFEGYIEELDAEREIYAPEVLGIDENHLIKKPRAVFVDIKERKLIEMLSDRSKKTVKNYINSLPNKENIKVVTMDMWRPYRNAVRETIPDAVVVIDKFHVVEEITNTLEKKRKAVKSSLSKADQNYLRKSRYLMRSNREDLNREQEKQLNKLFEKFPELERPYHMKELLRDIYNQNSREEAEQWYLYLKSLITDYEGADEFFEVFKTIDNWYTEIFNYFNHQYTNAVTESINRIINGIADAGRGYSFDVLRAKALYRPKVKKLINMYSQNDKCIYHNKINKYCIITNIGI